MTAPSDSPRTVRRLRDLLANSGTITDGTTRASGFATVQLPGAWRTRRFKTADRSRRPSAQGIFAARGEEGVDGTGAKEQLEEWQLPDEAAVDDGWVARVDAFVDRVFFQAGTTPNPGAHSTQVPLLVFCPCYLPTAESAVSVSQVLDRLLVRIEPFVDGPFVAILFSSPMPEGLSTQLLLSLYFKLSKPTRKNLQRLYIVHPSLFVRLTTRLFLSGVVSGKVGRKGKLRSIAKLSDLGRELDFSAVEVPPAVMAVNAKLEASIGEPTEARQFGVELVVGEPSRVVTMCLAALSTPEAMLTPGIFRISASSAHVKQIRQLVDRGHPVDLAAYDGDAGNCAASVLKAYIAALLRPIFRAEMYAAVERCPIGDATAIRERILPQLSDGERELLRSVFQVLHDLSLRSEANKMDAANLATCIAPVLLRSDDVVQDARQCVVAGMRSMGGGHEGGSGASTVATVVRTMIDRFWDVFVASPISTPSLTSSPSTRPGHRTRQSTSSSRLTRDSASLFAPPSIRLVGRTATIGKGGIAVAQAVSVDAAALFESGDSVA